VTHGGENACALAHHLRAIALGAGKLLCQCRARSFVFGDRTTDVHTSVGEICQRRQCGTVNVLGLSRAPVEQEAHRALLDQQILYGAILAGQTRQRLDGLRFDIDELGLGHQKKTLSGFLCVILVHPLSVERRSGERSRSVGFFGIGLAFKQFENAAKFNHASLASLAFNHTFLVSSTVNANDKRERGAVGVGRAPEPVLGRFGIHVNGLTFEEGNEILIKISGSDGG